MLTGVGMKNLLSAWHICLIAVGFIACMNGEAKAEEISCEVACARSYNQETGVCLAAAPRGPIPISGPRSRPTPIRTSQIDMCYRYCEQSQRVVAP